MPSKPLRIVRIIARLNVGGPARHVILLTEKFREKGWQSDLVVGEVGKAEASMEALGRSRGIEPIKISELGRELNPVKDLLVLWRLYHLLCRLKPDIVHTHTAKAGAVGRMAAFLYRRAHWRGLWAPRPVLVFHTFHGHVLRGYFSPLKEKVFRRLERFLGRLSTKLITLSPDLRRELVEMGVAHANMVEVIPLGLELDAFLARDGSVPETKPLRRELGLAGDTPLVGIVGRLVPIKDHVTFLQAAFRVVKENNGNRAGRAHFVIVGDGELRGELEAMSRALGIGERCHFTGWREDLPDIYEGLDLVALTSVNEGTPLSLIEAMAAGRPVVSTRVGGVADLLGDSAEREIPREGFRMLPVGALAGPGDPAGLAGAMARLLQDAEEALWMGDAGRALVRERYSIDRLVADLERLYIAEREGTGMRP